MAETTVGNLICNYEFSSARRVLLDYEIFWPDKLIEVRMRTNDGSELISPEAIEILIRRKLPDDYGICAFDIDGEERAKTIASTWKVVLWFANQRLTVRAIKPLLGGMILEIHAAGADGESVRPGS